MRRVRNGSSTNSSICARSLLTYRVFAFDVLASHASADERRSVVHQHRWPLLAMGVVCGYLGAAPLLVWAVGAATVVFAPVLVVVSVWLYTLVFAFAACWFAHYALSALQRLREQTMSNVNANPMPPVAIAAPGATAPLKAIAQP